MPETDQDRWLTYAEAGQLLGISPAAARMHAKRRGWQRRSPNAIGAHAMVLMPPDAAVQPRATAVQRTFAPRAPNEPNGADQPNVQANAEHVRVISSAIEALREQLAIANQRAERAELCLDAERARVDALQALLSVERRRVIEVLTGSARRAWWRRWVR